MARVSCCVGKAVKQAVLEVEVTVPRRSMILLRARLWLAAQIIRLAALVAGCGFKKSVGGPNG